MNILFLEKTKEKWVKNHLKADFLIVYFRFHLYSSVLEDKQVTGTGVQNLASNSD